ncbi:unnamed protein product [Acanthoscelides obtectus]|uniref:HTH psq-type domain-containing protein n=1 Tax=Acanthoscelides obtectus TaxID=200917 RepID=A0A9P0Q2W2_ACAOB|nr:unnamed protein product [Acanthoscelides obtectus]CAK1633326.1 hypothetical protein AOBTE_LOCUS8046 [Acanthoscelides obtectus]
MEITKKKPYPRFRYTEETLQEVLQMIRTNLITISEASRRYSIPKSTLSNKLTGKVPQMRKMGPDTVLSSEEESNLEKWILSKALLRFPMHSGEVKVQKVLKETERDNPFTDDRPGKKWLQLFLQRHPSITAKHRNHL